MPGKGKRFESGNTGGPGRPANPPEVNAMSRITKARALSELGAALEKPIVELQEILKNPALTGFEHIMARIVVSAAQGNANHLSFAFDRLFGKVSQEIKHQVVEPLFIEYGDGTGVALTCRNGDTMSEPAGKQ